MVFLKVDMVPAEPATTCTAGGLDFTAEGGKRQGREGPRSVRVLEIQSAFSNSFIFSPFDPGVKKIIGIRTFFSNALYAAIAKFKACLW